MPLDACGVTAINIFDDGIQTNRRSNQVAISLSDTIQFHHTLKFQEKSCRIHKRL